MARSQPKPLLPGPRPTHRVYRVQGDGDNARWLAIGAAWPNKDGKGFSLSLDALPNGGRIVVRLISQRTDGGQQ